MIDFLATGICGPVALVGRNEGRQSRAIENMTPLRDIAPTSFQRTVSRLRSTHATCQADDRSRLMVSGLWAISFAKCG
jgi:hypothetical protein